MNNKIRDKFTSNSKLTKIKDELKKYRQIAQEYLKIMRKIDRGPIEPYDFEFLEMNSGILQI